MTEDNLVDPTFDGSNDYNSANVQILRDADHIRRRPGFTLGILIPPVYITSSMNLFTTAWMKPLQVFVKIFKSISMLMAA